MHNLFLSTAKRMMDKWTAGGDINSGQLNDMQKISKTMILPASYTSLTAKIGKRFSFMKADEWKSWVLAYSPVLLKDILNNDKFKNWMDFVDACRLLAKPSISFEELDDAHDYLEKLCQKCERLYPPSVLTCNMHLHLHLRETVRDFGPVYGYWLFGLYLHPHFHLPLSQTLNTNSTCSTSWTLPCETVGVVVGGRHLEAEGQAK
ncbi:hypothetical protein CLU79DRAFT_745261 [Phycomyces nitens]|nr:hypothetical protein CLU79DRAFT_745261 [Phycomyces nitens]